MFPKAGRIKIQAITPSSLFPTLLATRNRQTFSIRSINQAATSQQDFGVAERQGNARRSTNHYFLAGFSWKGLEASNLTSDSGSAELVRMCVHKISIYLSVCLSLSICLSVCLPSYLCICLSVCLSACLPACLSVCLSVYLSTVLGSPSGHNRSGEGIEKKSYPTGEVPGCGKICDS